MGQVDFQVDYTHTLDEMKSKLMRLLSSPSHRVSEIIVSPTKHGVPGVYVIKTPDESEVVYVGRTSTKSIAGRIKDHHTAGTSSDLNGMLKRFNDYPQKSGDYIVQYLKVDDSRERVMFEHFSIAVLTPTFNR